MRYIILAVIFGWKGCMLHNFGLFANAKLFLVSRNLDKDEGELMFSSCQASVKREFEFVKTISLHISSPPGSGPP